ncbi:energy-coupling factor transporter transmembrane component T [uncultured Adlercreutzia sp.]|uniref:energy-coupling factor transporter transmembrane component T n=1 Tax=uncultured Adlercreutzia sp. TaxID=875803 RepID=UPI0026F3F184|nr:energy-coupling factor transporter transmembrane component T [uncultured Adlercreutzia sp.]
MTPLPQAARSAVDGWHPALAFLFFAGALLGCMVLANPACLMVSFSAAGLLYGSLRGREAWRFIAGLVAVVVVVACATPLFTTDGATVLFRWLGGRPYTAEALALGASTGLALAAMMLWFASYHLVMTSEKFTFLFGRVAPALSLLLTMTLRLVPAYRRKADALLSARACIGKGARESDSLRERVAAGATVLGHLSADALEGAVVTADSLRSRGFGLAGRTHFGIFRWTVRDSVILGLLAAVAVASVALMGPWGFGLMYFPTVVFPAPGASAVAGLVCYGLFLAAPAVANGERRLAWRWSLSRM